MTYFLHLCTPIGRLYCFTIVGQCCRHFDIQVWANEPGRENIEQILLFNLKEEASEEWWRNSYYTLSRFTILYWAWVNFVNTNLSCFISLLLGLNNFSSFEVREYIIWFPYRKLQSKERDPKKTTKIWTYVQNIGR